MNTQTKVKQPKIGDSTRTQFWFSISDDGIEIFDKDSKLFATCTNDNEGAVNAAMIVNALNSNPDLLEAAKRANVFILALAKDNGLESFPYNDELQAAIKKATE